MGKRMELLSLAVALAMAVTLAEAHAGRASMSEDCAKGSPSVQPLAKIINTRDASFQCLGVSVDGRANIRAIRFEKHERSTARKVEDDSASEVSVREFTPAEIASEHGAVLDGVPGHDAVMLRGAVDAAQTNVPLVVTFLHNGLTGEYRACRTTLVREADENWRLLDARLRPVSLVVVRTWALPLIGTVGIEAVQGICSATG